ncbi:MAG: hypothetical protein JNK45_33535 [Myxococcales bacterium]|nr:hypothetical protein [Myxococcales bacterium]
MSHPASRLALVLPMSVAASLASIITAGDATASPSDALQDHPRGTYVIVDPPISDAPAPQAGVGQHILFLNRCLGGETITPGPEDSSANTSSILSFAVDFPEFPYGDATWNEMMARARQIFAPFDIQVTDVDPGNTPHDEVIVCGDGASAGFQGAGGVAPFSCGVIPRAITYVFAETMGNNPDALAIVVGQEAAHAWGLDHEYKCDDPMTYLNWCGDVQYQDGDYPCGEYSERACSCGGNTQNSYQHILGLFGPSTPDTQSPVATITSPTDGAEYESGSDFEIAVDVSDDVDVVSVTLFVNGEPQASDDTAPFGPWPATDTPDGTYEFHVEAEDFAGNVGSSPVVTVEVGPGALDPEPTDGGGDPSGDAGTEGGDAGDDDPADPDDDGGNDGAFGTDGALPPGFGAGRGDGPEACACTGGEPSGAALVAPWLVAIAAARRSRRRRA